MVIMVADRKLWHKMGSGSIINAGDASNAGVAARRHLRLG